MLRNAHILSFENIHMQWDWDRLATGESNKQVRGNSPWRPRGESG